MVFSSLIFLCVFLPLAAVLYFLVPPGRRFSMPLKNALLIVLSLLFYAYGEPVYIILMLLSSVANWLLALWIGAPAVQSPRPLKQTGRRLPLVLCVVFNLGMLAVFKYADMFVPALAISLPIGISFYTFQAMSYVIDVYRGEVEAARNYFNVLLYITFFPQLIAGPIIKYHDVESELGERRQSLREVVLGCRRFICGLGKKVLLANTLGAVADSMYGAPFAQINVACAWLGAICYLAQIYFDFSGYSDMAIGMARIFGFHYPENFDYPYASASIREFWRRWHISLSTWFKQYLYFPLGGNRKGRPRAVANKVIVFAVCGLWHGAAWTFLVWGLVHGFFLLLEEYLPIRKLPRPLGVIYTLLVVCLAFVLFRSSSFAQAAFMLGQMFSGFHFETVCTARLLWNLNPPVVLALIAAAVAATPVLPALRHRLSGLGGSASTSLDRRASGATLLSPAGAASLKSALHVASYVLSVALLVFCLLQLAPGGYNPFIYYRF
ncbi:MAG: MBOAT family protein [Coriobacteriales bacterium]|jgi:alginate O-acetyltransferase complex protein AlgI|nr:MBOAT family protein [Coriobacteriales bacterium]